MLRRLWTDHRWACLLSLALLVVGVVVSPWVLLAAVLPIVILIPKFQTKMSQPLTGKNLRRKIKELGELPRSEMVQKCGYTYLLDDGTEELDFGGFQLALMESKGWTFDKEPLTEEEQEWAEECRKLNPVAVVQENGSLVINKYYLWSRITRQINPGDKHLIFVRGIHTDEENNPKIKKSNNKSFLTALVQENGDLLISENQTKSINLKSGNKLEIDADNFAENKYLTTSDDYHLVLIFKPKVEELCQCSEPRYYFNLNQGQHQPRVLILQQDFIGLDKNKNQIGSNVITYSICYGYSGGGIQSDFLFKEETSHHRIIFYSDCSGGEWHGAKKTEPYSRAEELDSKKLKDRTGLSLEWSKTDEFAYSEIMKKWNDFFEEDHEKDIYIANKNIIGHKDFKGISSSDDFPTECLYDFSEIWNFLTLYEREDEYDDYDDENEDN